jgi:hypothetical protein
LSGSDDSSVQVVDLPLVRVAHRPGKLRRGLRRDLAWGELLRRVIGFEINTSPACGGSGWLLAAISDPAYDSFMNG